MARTAFEELVWAYGMQGIDAWGGANATLKTALARVLGHNKIAHCDADLSSTLNQLAKPRGNPDRFIPMPTAGRKGLSYSFFLPVKTRRDIAFDLLLFVNTANRMGFRFEPPHLRGESHHAYGHVQLCRKMCGSSIDVGIPDWFPETYPAIPIGVSDPEDLFLAMVVSMHGCPGGNLQILQDMFAGQPVKRDYYQRRVNRLLDRQQAA